MRRAALIAVLVIPVLVIPVLATLPAWAQQASDTETAAVSSLGDCLVQGLTREWTSVEMLVELNEPGSTNGNVQYTVLDAENSREAFTPCDLNKPVTLLLRLRDRQPEERRGWTSARFVL